MTRAHRYQRKLTLIVFDLDDFKSINDQVGHLAGDRVLAQAADRLREAVRSVDVACRIGGDEFAVIMPESSADDGDQLYRRVHNSMRGTALGPDEQRLRLSGGIAELLHGDTPASLFERADAALYRAKELGKDRADIARAGELTPTDHGRPARSAARRRRLGRLGDDARRSGSGARPARSGATTTLVLRPTGAERKTARSAPVNCAARTALPRRDDPRVVGPARRRALEAPHENRGTSAAADGEDEVAFRAAEDDAIGARLGQQRERLPLDLRRGRRDGLRRRGRRRSGLVGRPHRRDDRDAAEHHGADAGEQREQRRVGWATDVSARGTSTGFQVLNADPNASSPTVPSDGRRHRCEGDLRDGRHARDRAYRPVLSDHRPRTTGVDRRAR